MKRKTALLMVGLSALGLFILFTGVACAPAASSSVVAASDLPIPENCLTYQGERTNGSIYMICMPGEGQPAWNGDLLVYAHGYMAFNRPIEIPPDQMVIPGPGGTVAVNDLVTSMGYAFATTSYYTNGLAVLPAIVDLVDLVGFFEAEEATPTRVLLGGVSEGGLITTLAIEQHPDVFDGGLAMCGPYGGFHEQVDHFGDFRVVFDYFFPGLMPGSPVTVPTELIDDVAWTYHFTSTVEPAVTDPANAISVTQLLSVTGASPYTFDPPTSTVTIEKLLWYNVFATEDAKKKLGGQPFDNKDPWHDYQGSLDDEALNAGVERISADDVAIDTIKAFYQTTGYLDRPLVTLHTTGDFVVPYFHAPLYQAKINAAGRERMYRHFASDVHGHCSFGALDVLVAFQTLEEMLPQPIFLPLVVRPATTE